MKKYLLSFLAAISSVQLLLFVAALSFSSCGSGGDEPGGDPYGDPYVVEVDNETQVITDCQNKANTTITTNCDFDNFVCHVTFNSSLSSLHPRKSFVYGFEYGLKNSSSETYETGKSSFTGDVQIEGYVEYNMYKGSLSALDEKLRSGQTLTQSEKALYSDLTKHINELRTKARNNFVVKGYVKYGGVKYYVN